MEMPVPEADPAAVARMKYEAANHVEPGMFHKLTDFMRRNPDVSDAAKSGRPPWIRPKREIPVTVPQSPPTARRRLYRRCDGSAGDRTLRARYPARRASRAPAPSKPGDAAAAAPGSRRKAIARHERDPAGG